MSWFRRLEDRLSGFVHEVGRDIAKIGGEIVHAASDALHAGEAAIGAVVHDAPKIALETVNDTYRQLVGNDLTVLRDRHASLALKAEAAFDLATTFTMPLEKLPAVVGEMTLKNLVREGETTAIAAALDSLRKSGDVPAMIGVEKALLDADPATAKTMQAAGVDTAQATAALAAIKKAVAAGEDLPQSAKTAVGDLASALGGRGDRLASLHAAFGALKTAAADVAAIEASAKTTIGIIESPASPSARLPSDADLVRAALAKFPAETIERIRRGGRAEIGLPHLEATPWNGRAQIGSITSVIGARVEQYTGTGWTTYDARTLAPLQEQLAANAVSGDPRLVSKISPGDELRVGANGSIELIPHDVRHPELQAVRVAAGGRSENVESVALGR